MINSSLILYGRKGCCLCEALIKKLESISLEDIKPPLKLYSLDIDSDVSKIEKIKYDLEVPVLFFKLSSSSNMIELPRVAPRLNQESLKNWLQNIINKKIEIKDKST